VQRFELSPLIRYKHSWSFT